MKTKPMRHQLDALRADNDREAYGLFMEQGTGKTWVTLALAERLYSAGKIDGLLVVAPNGVHTNWILREIPAHMEVPVAAAAWRSGAGKREVAALEQALFRPRDVGDVPGLRVLTMSYDAINTAQGSALARRFLLATKALMVLDESGRVKNPSAARTKRVMALRHMAPFRRILNGTPLGNGPLCLFSQFDFLGDGLLGTTSYRSFVAEYAELVSMDSYQMKRMVQANPRIAHAQIVAKDEATGAPIWRNMAKLQSLVGKHSFRVLKADCLDLPPKVYQERRFELLPATRQAYRLMREEARLVLEDGAVASVKKLAAMIKLQQISSGFVRPPPDPKNPRAERDDLQLAERPERLEALLDLLEDVDGQFIVWARFRPELAAVAAALRAAGLAVAEYHGGVGPQEREAAVDDFQAGRARAFVGQPHSGGIGLTLTAASTVIYYSNDFSHVVRAQSEDRAHRVGTKSAVLYVDLIAEDTLDDEIVGALRRKESFAAEFLAGAAAFSGDN